MPDRTPVKRLIRMINVGMIAVITSAAPVIRGPCIIIEVIAFYNGVPVILDLDVFTVVNVDVYITATVINIDIITTYIINSVTADVFIT
jgi:hypothetical protein